ncbi:zZinc finger CCCH domain-containing protein 33 [Scenedesmus sp. PABB004]|nr:zZinc finger CCCH domain-containing protein 33 [Scenedesmus sp. PABB004]
MCPAVKKGMHCAEGPERCPWAHSSFELWLHPSRYKTSLCRKGAACKRGICFFAHAPEEVRAGGPRTPAQAMRAAAQAGAGAGAARAATPDGGLAARGGPAAAGLLAAALPLTASPPLAAAPEHAAAPWVSLASLAGGLAPAGGAGAPRPASPSSSSHSSTSGSGNGSFSLGAAPPAAGSLYSVSSGAGSSGAPPGDAAVLAAQLQVMLLQQRISELQAVEQQQLASLQQRALAFTAVQVQVGEPAPTVPSPGAAHDPLQSMRCSAAATTQTLLGSPPRPVTLWAARPAAPVAAAGWAGGAGHLLA